MGATRRVGGDAARGGARCWGGRATRRVGERAAWGRARRGEERGAWGVARGVRRVCVWGERSALGSSVLGSARGVGATRRAGFGESARLGSAVLGRARWAVSGENAAWGVRTDQLGRVGTRLIVFRGELGVGARWVVFRRAREVDRGALRLVRAASAPALGGVRRLV